ncbi:ABC transporter, ATPase subunit [Candidatus Koribacter versatilis Ellin345]|uniref:ABC transporter, ATPase subunit n=1 Tax=Koribacter versatilis (strain Ellin345) TaxID=204669 RepID=Q1IMV2_KORVE|nr:ABC transporter ATP-binding protein [Candidatus Koribacter versatilis]ABF41798.1 ABC transporter, ATPase subunit [Candidatus Koribacter versatilis Ellin345]
MKLTVENVSKRYGNGVQALRDFSLELGPGVLGLLGPNGAGKSTLMSILATITLPSAGRVLWDDGKTSVDTAAHPNVLRNVLGFLPQDFGVYPNLSALEYLEYLAAIKGIDGKTAKSRIEELLTLVNLQSAKTRKLGGYSGGMRQRVGIAQALLNDPKLLIVDEPTAGLDPEERVRFRNLLSELSHDRIVILSTHIVSDVELTADRIALVAAGQLITCQSPDQLLNSLDGRVWECVVPPDMLAQFKSHHACSGMVRRQDGVHVRVVSDEKPWHNAESEPAVLEDAYLHWVNAPVEVAA